MKKQKLTQRQYNLIELIVSMPEASLKKSLEKALLHYYDEKDIIISENYIYAKGVIPVGLIAHLDTIHQFPAYEIYHDPFKNVLWSPYGIGADDRAGVFSILEILRKGYRPSVIFCCKEEVGGIGASCLILDYPKPPSELNYLIELDRQGENDAVYYKCNNKDFSAMIESYGFEASWGSFSDISILAPRWEIAAVNLSVGYYDEHSLGETWHYCDTLKTIDVICKILENSTDKKYKYVPGRSLWDTIALGAYGQEDNICDACGKSIAEEMTIAAYEDNQVYNFCPDCATKYVNFCPKCYEPYIEEDKHICGGLSV